MVIPLALASIGVGAHAPAAQLGRQPAALSAGLLHTGAPVATISIPRLRFNGIAHQCIGAPVLAFGPGHYPSTALPGETGTTAFAGHRVTHTHPQRRLQHPVLTACHPPHTALKRYVVFARRIVPGRLQR
jgi:sortase (surface protein transpeptidase)